MRRMKSIIKKWYLAHFTTSACWRVRYHSGGVARLLSWHEAKSLKEIFGGTMYIDYNETYGGGEQ